MPTAQPTSIKVHKTSGTTMEIGWNDGHQSTYSFAYLRAACPCALCNEERGKSHRPPDQPTPPDASALQMFKPQLRPVEVSQVGNYAISFNWNDGHKHGIFSWDYLRNWCPCADCRAARHSADALKRDMDTHVPRQK
jgi:DUF971 family protein